jgi:hypothetical protein
MTEKEKEKEKEKGKEWVGVFFGARNITAIH